MITNSTGWVRGALAERRRIDREGDHAGQRPELRDQLARDRPAALRLRCSQGFRRRIAIAVVDRRKPGDREVRGRSPGSWRRSSRSARIARRCSRPSRPPAPCTPAEDHAAVFDRREFRLAAANKKTHAERTTTSSQTSTISQRRSSTQASSAAIAAGECRRASARSPVEDPAVLGLVPQQLASTSSATASARRSPTRAPHRPASARTR